MIIAPGDFVECIRHMTGMPPSGRVEPRLPVVGGVYRVREIADGLNGPGLLFTSPRVYDAGGYEWAFTPDYFRPVYRPKADLIERLMEKVEA